MFILLFCNDEEEYANVDGGEEGDNEKFYDEVMLKFVPKTASVKMAHLCCL